MLVKVFSLSLLLVTVAYGFSINPFDTRSVSARVFGSLDDLYEFIGDDRGFDYLKEDTEILDTGKDPKMEVELQKLIAQYDQPEVIEGLEELSWQSLEIELEILNDKLEAVYERLLEFSKILVSLTEEDLFEMADGLAANPIYYEKVMNDEIDPLSMFKSWTPTASKENDIIGTSSIEHFDILNDNHVAEDGFKYWDPDVEYDLIGSYLENESPEAKWESVIEATGIFKLIKKTLKKIKLFFSLLLKLFKLAKILRLKEIKICLKIMKTIEKIKKCLMLIKAVIIKKIKKLIKGFPFNIIYKIKMLIRLILKIIIKILWEVKMIITEILIKLYYFLKKIKRAPIVLKIYIKQEIYERLGGEDHDQQNAWDDFGEWDDQVNEGWRDYNDIDTVYDDGLQYAIGSGHKPKELDMLFKKQFTAQEYKELERDDFNHEIVYAFEDEAAPILQPRHEHIAGHEFIYGAEDDDEFNISIPNFNLTLQSELIDKLKDINVTVVTNSTIQEVSEGMSLRYRTCVIYILPWLLILFTRLVI